MHVGMAPDDRGMGKSQMDYSMVVGIDYLHIHNGKHTHMLKDVGPRGLYLNFIHSAYTTRMLQPSKFRILKIRESSARALFLYNCTPNISRSADVSVSVS